MKWSWDIWKMKKRPSLNGEIMRLILIAIHGEMEEEFVKSTRK